MLTAVRDRRFALQVYRTSTFSSGLLLGLALGLAGWLLFALVFGVAYGLLVSTNLF
jgi:hypothetical protein